VSNWRLAQNYREVKAEVVVHKDQIVNGGLDIWYSVVYDVDGKSYYNERLTVLDYFARNEPDNTDVARVLENAYKNKAKISIWVSPGNPATAFVSRDFPFQAVLRRSMLGVAFAVVALAGIVGLVGALFNFGYYRKYLGMTRSWGTTAVVCAVIFPLRLLFVDAHTDYDDAVNDTFFVIEIIAFLFLWGSVSIMFEPDINDPTQWKRAYTPESASDKTDGLDTPAKAGGRGKRKRTR
jgi:hypothetical protein